MSSTTKPAFAQDAWQTTNNARTLRAYMALRNQEIGARIRGLRGPRTQAIVAEAIGASPRTLQTWEAGDAKPSYRSLQKIAEFFGVTEGFILEGIDDRPIVEGVPEQLTEVDGKFSELVAEVVNQLNRIEQALARNEDKLDRLMHLVDAGLFLSSQNDEPADPERRQEEPLRGVAVGPILAQAFEALEPDTLSVLQERLRAAQEPPQRSAGKRSHAAK